MNKGDAAFFDCYHCKVGKVVATSINTPAGEYDAVCLECGKEYTECIIPEAAHKPIPCPYCRDLGRNARTGLACLHCVRGLAILNAELVGVRPESQTDRLTMAWRRLHEVQSGVWPAMSDNSRMYLERAMWEAERCLRDAIDHMADMETVEWLRRGKEERMRARLSATADQPTVTLDPIAELLAKHPWGA